jgi:hypothetical protein
MQVICSYFFRLTHTIAALCCLFLSTMLAAQTATDLALVPSDELLRAYQAFVNARELETQYQTQTLKDAA